MANPFDNNPLAGALAVEVDTGGGLTVDVESGVVVVEVSPLGIGTAGPTPYLPTEAWAQTISYTAGPPASVVTYNNGLYACKTSHTSTSTFDATKWTPILDPSQLNAAIATGVAAVQTQQTTSVAAVQTQQTTSVAAVVTQENTSKAAVAAVATPVANAVTDAVNAKMASEAARDVTTAARDLTLGYRDAAAGSTTAADNSNSAAQSALLQSISYAAVAQAGAASVSAQTGLSILAAAQRAIKLTANGNSACPYDVTRDDDSGAWLKKATTQSYLSDTLNTATRGTVAPLPLQSAIIGEPTVLSVFSNVDGTGSLWKSWTVAGLTCVFARNGSIYYGASNGLFVLDLISDKVFLYQTGGLYVCVNQNVATYNQGTATWSLIGSSAQLPSNVVNSVAATIAPNTPNSPARCNLPNPTSAVGTGGGASVIRWDGVAVNSASTAAVLSLCFDIPALPGAAPNLWTLTAAGLNVTNQYQSASWAVAGLASFTAAQLGVGTLAKVSPCGPNMVAVAGSTGLARIKLDPTNPANSLINIKKTTVDATWQVLGKTAFALAESSAALSAYPGGATITDQSASASNFTVVGGLNRAVVATGADTAGLTGWGVGNYATGAAIALGSADFEFPVSIVGASITGTQTYLSHGYYTAGAYSGARVLLQSSTSTLTATFHDGTNSASISVSSALAAGGNYDLRLIYRSALTRFELWSNGVLIGTAARGSVGSLTNASANLFVGVDPALANPTVSTVILALIRAWTYAPTPDQIAFIYADEKPRFAANAQSLLTGANVQGVAWCPDTEQLAAPNSTAGCDVFKGSVRVANDNSTVVANKVRDSNMLTAVAGVIGSGGALPSGMSVTGLPSGLTANVVGVGKSGQNGYFDLQISGTPGSTSTGNIYLQNVITGAGAIATSGIGASTGQTWSAGVGMQLVGGAMTNVGGTLMLDEWSATPTQLAQTTGALSPTGTMTRTSLSRTFNQATTAQAVCRWNMQFTSGQAVNFTVRVYQPNIAQAASDVYSDSLSQSANAKAVAFANGKLAVVTAAGVDVKIPAADGQRAINDGIGAAKRPFYDPTWGQYSGVTTDATPTVFASIPIPEGKAFRFRATVVAVMYGGTATEKAVYDITGVVSRDIGGNVVVVSTTTTISEVTSSMDCIAQANTTAQTLEIKATGKAATRIAWFDGQELYDVGLMAAA